MQSVGCRSCPAIPTAALVRLANGALRKPGNSASSLDSSYYVKVAALYVSEFCHRRVEPQPDWLPQATSSLLRIRVG